MSDPTGIFLLSSMFRCQLCGRAMGARVPATRLVLESRPFNHPYRARSKRKWQLKKGQWKYDWEPDHGGAGSMIVREALACPDCARTAVTA